jgi:large subunit ribosomal protein L18
MATANKTLKRKVRQVRIRAKVSGTPIMPRLSVFKSNKYIYAQLIDDTLGKTIAASEGKTIKAKTKTEQAKLVGEDIAKKAIAQKIKKIVFDRGGYIYTGRVKALAESAREAGLQF